MAATTFLKINLKGYFMNSQLFEEKNTTKDTLTNVHVLHVNFWVIELDIKDF